MLGLNAMEVQFVRVNTMERYATDDDAGRLPNQVEGELVVDILRENKKGDLVPSIRKGQKLKEGDMVRTLKYARVWGRSVASRYTIRHGSAPTPRQSR